MDYSKIKTHSELIRAIQQIDSDLSRQSQRFQTDIDNVKYQFSFMHLFQIATSKYTLYVETASRFISEIQKLYGYVKNFINEKRSARKEKASGSFTSDNAGSDTDNTDESSADAQSCEDTKSETAVGDTNEETSTDATSTTESSL